MDKQPNQSNHPIPQSPISNLQPPLPKAQWTPPVLRVTPIAETAGAKADATGDGTNAFSS